MQKVKRTRLTFFACGCKLERSMLSKIVVSFVVEVPGRKWAAGVQLLKLLSEALVGMILPKASNAAGQ
jgi:hypothetical protein